MDSAGISRHIAHLGVENTDLLFESTGVGSTFAEDLLTFVGHLSSIGYRKFRHKSLIKPLVVLCKVNIRINTSCNPSWLGYSVSMTVKQHLKELTQLAKADALGDLNRSRGQAQLKPLKTVPSLWWSYYSEEWLSKVAVVAENCPCCHHLKLMNDSCPRGCVP